MVIKKDIWITPYACNRTLHIYVPDNLSKENPAAVLYMFDGHNLFFDRDATFGKSWGMKKYLDRKKAHLIVVGLECNHEGDERLSEFTPYSYDDWDYGYVNEKGRDLAQWMVEELKPWVDANFPTIPDREHTYIGGSSLGGTMAFYMMLMYSDVYSKGAVISPHIYPMFKSVRKDLGHEMHPDTTVYMSWGGKEYPTHRIFALATDQNLQIMRALMSKPGVNVIPHSYKNMDHSESAWEKELPIWFRELGLLEE